MKIRTVRAASAALICLGIAGCSLFGQFRHRPPPPPPAPPPAPPAEPLPVANERFELAPGQDVVGVVQVVTAGKDDTLTDIARRFNVGYEEIVRANPRVDPWLPGEGHEIIVPSQFVLPDAPRTGLVINIAAMRIFYYPPAKRGERQVRDHPPDRHRQGRLAHPGRGHQDRAPPEGPDLARAGVGAQGAPRERRGPRPGDRSGAGQSARQVRVLPAVAELPDPRHQQAGRRRAALEPRLHPPVPGGHRAVLQHGADRHPGARRQPAVRVRLA